MLSESARIASRCSYEPTVTIVVARRQRLSRPPGCRGWRRCESTQSGTCTQLTIRYALFLRRAWLSVPSSPATVHEGTTGLDAAAATEPPRVAGTIGVHGRCSSARSHLVYARWRFHICLPPPVASLSSGSHPRRATVHAPASQRLPY